MRKESDSEPKETRYEQLRVIARPVVVFTECHVEDIIHCVELVWILMIIGLDRIFFSISIYQSIFLLLIFHINSN